jgi:hypothetical protein
MCAAVTATLTFVGHAAGIPPELSFSIGSAIGGAESAAMLLRMQP